MHHAWVVQAFTSCCCWWVLPVLVDLQKFCYQHKVGRPSSALGGNKGSQESFINCSGPHKSRTSYVVFIVCVCVCSVVFVVVCVVLRIWRLYPKLLCVSNARSCVLEIVSLVSRQAVLQKMLATLLRSIGRSYKTSRKRCDVPWWFATMEQYAMSVIEKLAPNIVKGTVLNL